MLQLKTFLVFATVLHLPFVWLFLTHTPILTLAPTKKTVAQTVKLQSSPEPIAAVEKPTRAPPPPPKPKPKPKSEPKSKPKEPKKTVLSEKQKEQLSKLRDSYKPTSEKVSSTSTQQLSKLTLNTSNFESYGKTLTEELKRRLILPEFGAVKVALTIQADGSISEMQILETESDKNKRFVLKKLQNVRLPKPPKGRSPQTFVVTLIGGI
jgi:outer membrane biosynthesis protein TonB